MSCRCKMRQNGWRRMRSSKIEIGEWLAGAKRRLIGHEQPGLEAQVLLGHVSGMSRAGLLAHPEKVIDPGLLDRLNNLLERLARGEPLPYLVGRWQFYGLEFEVSPDVLIPRPETELLVEQALEWQRSHPKNREMVDVGTGSGCIAISLVVNQPGLHALAVDRSWEALRVAERNIQKYNIGGQVRLACCDLLTAFKAPFSLITANLPYIPTLDLSDLEVARSEPGISLDGGSDGLGLIRRLLADSPRWLAEGGLLLLEIEAGQARQVQLEVCRWLPDSDVTTLRDLSGKDRVVRIQRNS